MPIKRSSYSLLGVRASSTSFIQSQASSGWSELLLTSSKTWLFQLRYVSGVSVSGSLLVAFFAANEFCYKVHRNSAQCIVTSFCASCINNDHVLHRRLPIILWTNSIESKTELNQADWPDWRCCPPRTLPATWPRNPSRSHPTPVSLQELVLRFQKTTD